MDEKQLEEFLKSPNGVNEQKSSLTLDLGDDKVVYEQLIDFVAPTTGVYYEGNVIIKESNIFEVLEVAKNLRKYDKLIKDNDARMLDIEFGVIKAINDILFVRSSDRKALVVEDNYLAIRLFTAILNVAGPTIGANSKQPQGSAIGGAPRR